MEECQNSESPKTNPVQPLYMYRNVYKIFLAKDTKAITVMDINNNRSNIQWLATYLCDCGSHSVEMDFGFLQESMLYSNLPQNSGNEFLCVENNSFETSTHPIQPLHYLDLFSEGHVACYCHLHGLRSS